MMYRDEICDLEEGLAGHVGGGGDAHELEHGGGDVGQAAVAEAPWSAVMSTL